MTSTFNITKICNAVFPPRGEMTSTMKQNQTRLLKQYSDFSLESSKLVGKYSKEAVLIKYIIHLETKLKEKENEFEDLDTYWKNWIIDKGRNGSGFTKPEVNDISIKLDKIDDSISIKLDKVLQIANHRLKLWYINNNEKKVVEPKGPPRVDNNIRIEDIVKKSLCIPEILEYDYSEIDCMDNITYIEEDRQHVFDEFKMIYGGRSGRLSRMNRPIKESACIIIQKYVRRKLVQESNLLSPHQRKSIGKVIDKIPEKQKVNKKEIIKKEFTNEEEAEYDYWLYSLNKDKVINIEEKEKELSKELIAIAKQEPQEEKENKIKDIHIDKMPNESNNKKYKLLEEDGESKEILFISIAHCDNEINKVLLSYDGKNYDDDFGIYYYSQKHGSDIIENKIEGGINRCFKEIYSFNEDDNLFKLIHREKILC